MHVCYLKPENDLEERKCVSLPALTPACFRAPHMLAVAKEGKISLSLFLKMGKRKSFFP